jgi:hypothetical protein
MEGGQEWFEGDYTVLGTKTTNNHNDTPRTAGLGHLTLMLCWSTAFPGSVLNRNMTTCCSFSVREFHCPPGRMVNGSNEVTIQGPIIDLDANAGTASDLWPCTCITTEPGDRLLITTLAESRPSADFWRVRYLPR